MLVAHISDTHLGFRAFYRSDPETGMNQREADVLANFKANLDDILDAQPDLVIHSGDLFHVVRPSNHTIDQAFRLLMYFQDQRNFAPLVLVGGNHDTPKSSDSGNIQNLIAQIPGVHFAAARAESIEIRDYIVHCIPSWALKTGWQLPEPDALRTNILSLHGMALQTLPAAVDGSHADFDVNELRPDRWGYVALGDVHQHTVFAPNCCYAGSTDFTSSNIWGEIRDPKGWVLCDTAKQIINHRSIPTRPVIDLPVIDAANLSTDEIRKTMSQQCQFDGSPIVRQRIINLHASDRRNLFRAGLLRDLNSRCLNYQVATTAPDKTQVQAGGVSIQTETLEAKWRAHAAEAQTPSTVTTEALTDTGLDMLRAAQEAA